MRRRDALSDATLVEECAVDPLMARRRVERAEGGAADVLRAAVIGLERFLPSTTWVQYLGTGYEGLCAPVDSDASVDPTLIGTAEQITDELCRLSRAGLDGIVISWVNYGEELRQWIAEVMPLLVQAGLRVDDAGNLLR